MKDKPRRTSPVLHRVGDRSAEFDRDDDPLAFASLISRLFFGESASPSLPPLPDDPDVDVSDDPAARAAAFDAIGDVSYLFPDADELAIIRSLRPDYQPPSREERARNFLSDYLLCASLIESSDLCDRISSRLDTVAPSVVPSRPLGNVTYWQSRCRSVSSLIASLPPSREKHLLSLRYLRGIPIERAAEFLSVSRRTAYRIHRRALSLVGRVLDRKAKGASRRMP